MKSIAMVLTCALLSGALYGQARLSDLQLSGEIKEENLCIEMRLKLERFAPGETICLAHGRVALLEAELPAGWELAYKADNTPSERQGADAAEAASPFSQESGRLMLRNESRGWRARRAASLTLRFALANQADNETRKGVFWAPGAAIRPIKIRGDRADMEINVAGARALRREVAPDGGTTLSALLEVEGDVEVSWRRALRRLDSELILSCEAATIVNVAPGALRMTSHYSYSIAQGRLSELSFDLPETLNILQVSGADIQEWRVERDAAQAVQLRVALSRPHEERYELLVLYEQQLAPFPCKAELHTIVPRQVIRAGGTLLLGSDSAIKLSASDISGLTQIDQATFPQMAALKRPARDLFTYQYAAMPWSLNLSADDIVTSMNVTLGLIARLGESDFSLEANLQLEMRDAPAREVRLLVASDPTWTISAVRGAQVSESDVDVRPATNGLREVVVPFRKAIEGVVVVTLQMEQPFGAERDTLELPRIAVEGARSQHGYIIVAADKGFQLRPKLAEELREAHTAAMPLRVEGAQLAYRFREAPWRLGLKVARAQAALHSEIFHLVTLAEGVIYHSAAITCHISGAPLQQLQFHVPARIAALDVVGAGIEGWRREGDLCTVRLATRALGDFTLLLTHEASLSYEETLLTVGEIATIGGVSELGYIALASASNIKAEPSGALPPTLIAIQRDELPSAYASTVMAPLIAVFKYIRNPHELSLRITPYEGQRLIAQVVDYLALSSTVGRNGESVTHARYSVKNASRQYLSLLMPPQASLWSVTLLEGATTTARALTAQQAGERLLIPLDRPRDPNQALTIEVLYAQPGANHGKRAALEAPALPDTAVTFASWVVNPSEKLTLGAIKTNLMLERDSTKDGTTRRLYRSANLAGDEALRVTIELLPAWLRRGSLSLLIWLTAGGALLLLFALLWRQALLMAGALTLLGWAASLLAKGGNFAYPLLATIVLLAFMIVLLRTIVRACHQWHRTKPPLREVAAPESDSNSGHAAILPLLWLGAILAFALLLPLRGADSARIALPPLKLENLELRIEALVPEPLAEQSALVSRLITLEAQRGAHLRLLMHDEAQGEASDETTTLKLVGAVLSDLQYDEAAMELERDGAGLLFSFKRGGRHTIHLKSFEKIRESDERHWLELDIPAVLRNSFDLTVPAAEVELFATRSALLSQSGDGGATHASGTFIPFGRATIGWQPRARDTRREKVAIYCDLDTLATIHAGIVELSTRANYRVAQGEARELRLRLPAGITVTSVNGPNLATWSFDPANRLLLAILARPVSGDFALDIAQQAACSGLPYEIKLGALEALDVERQRGRVAFAAAESLLARFGALSGIMPINNDDFSDTHRAATESQETPLRRAFRYDDPAEVAIALRVEAVNPEIRVQKSAAFSIGDERLVLSSGMDIAIAKSGLFSLRLLLPEGYEIESLGGRDVSHWDDSRRQDNGVELFFTRRILGSTSINLVLARQVRGIPASLELPRVTVADAMRHGGRMAVAAERGVKLAIEQQDGVVLRRSAEESMAPASLNFELLRPGWSVKLRSEVMAPQLKPELLHHVELTEGMLQHRIYLRYKIENAGVKSFRLFVPVAEAALTLNGANIASVIRTEEQLEGRAGAIWRVELHGKVEDSYAFNCLYQEPYNPAAAPIAIRSPEALDTARRQGWLAVSGGSRVEVRPEGEVAGLKPEEANNLPQFVAAGDLSNAILAYRVLRPDYRLALAVRRHAAAEKLPATVESLSLVTVASSSGRLLTQAALRLNVGDLRILRVALPSPASELWTVTVNGAEAAVAREEALIRIPLEQLSAGSAGSVEIVFAERLADDLGGEVVLEAPRFPDLALRNIKWRLFTPPQLRYYLRGGDFDRLEASGPNSERLFSLSEYESRNLDYTRQNLELAKESLKSVDELLSSGQRATAQKMLQAAVGASQSEAALNEDARVQLRNVARQQVRIGLLNRRRALRNDNNIFDDLALPSQAGFNEGDFDKSFALRMEEQLTPQDREALDLVADRMVEQQDAADRRGASIHVAMPEQGRMLLFMRALQSETGGALQLKLAVRRAPPYRRLQPYWPLAALFPLLWGAIALALKRGSARA